jgi:hypothetical protein
LLSSFITQFTAKFTITLNDLLSIKSALSIACHPQTNGQTGHTNQELEQYLQLYMNFIQSDLSDWLSIAKFAYNNQQHSSTSHSPFYLEYGCHPQTLLTIDPPNTNTPAINSFLEQQELTRQSAFHFLE